MSEIPSRVAIVARQRKPVAQWSLGWFAVLGMIVLIISMSVVLLMRPSATAIKMAKDASFTSDAADWRGPPPIQVAKLFTQAQSHEARLKWISNPDADGWWMERFFADGAGATERVVDVKPLGFANNEAAAYVRFAVSLADGGKRLLCVITTTEGAKVDFRSYARFGMESWEDLLAGRTKICEEVRVFIEPSAYYLRNYADEKVWSSYLATTPDTAMPLYFYAPRGSVIDRALAKLTTGRPTRVTLAIRAPGDDYQHRQFEITECLTYGWVKQGHK